MLNTLMNYEDVLAERTKKVKPSFWRREYYWITETPSGLEIKDKDWRLLSSISYSERENGIYVEDALMTDGLDVAFELLVKDFVKRNKERKITGELYNKDQHFPVVKRVLERNGFEIDKVGECEGHNRYCIRKN